MFWSLRVGEQAYHVCLVAFSLYTISDEAMWSVRAGSCPADGAAQCAFYSLQEPKQFPRLLV